MIDSAMSESKFRANALQARRFYRVIIAVFFLSGFCGLLYQVVWSRLTLLIFGSTTYAVAAVLGVFMFGLALGGFLGGKLVARVHNHIRIYGYLEIGIGLFALLFIPLQSLVESLYAGVFPFVYENGFVLNIVRILLAFALMSVPTTLMGATLPLLGEALTRSPRFMGRDIGALYFINTIGAATGCFFTGFLFIPWLGLDVSIISGGAVNVLLGIVGLLIAGRLAHASPRPVAVESEPAPLPATPITPVQAYAVLVGFALSGMLGLSFEVAWSRALILVFGSSVYAFTTMLTTYLVGLALGGVIGGKAVDRVRSPVLMYCVLQGLFGALVLLTTPLIGGLPGFFIEQYGQADQHWQLLVSKQFLMCFMIMFPPTFLSGALFPVVSRIFLAARENRIGPAVGDVYAFNTLGGILGSLGAGFFFITLLGSEKTLVFGAALALCVAAAVAVTLTRPAALKYGLSAVCIALAVLLPIVLPSWNTTVMNIGVYNYAENLKNRLEESKTHDLSDMFSHWKPIFYEEGTSATVSVYKVGDNLTLRVNGKADGSDGPRDIYTQIFLAHLPAMYSRSFDKGLVVGLGTGITLGSMLDYPYQHIDCAEISPAVVRASEYFEHVSGDPLSSPRTRLLVLDGRTWLMGMPETYNVITCEPSNPWQTGNANLFTVDFYRIAEKRLAPDGIFCQWLPLYGNVKSDFQLLLKSFAEVFPHINLWAGSRGNDILLIGSKTPLRLSYLEMKQKLTLEPVQKRLEQLHITEPEELLSFFYLDEKGVQEFIGETRGLNTDNHPVVEFSSPKYVLQGGEISRDTLLELLKMYPRNLPPLVDVAEPAELRRVLMRIHAQYMRRHGYDINIR